MKQFYKTDPVLIVIAAILWALDGVVRRSLYVLPPITIVFFEHLIGSAILLLFAWKSLAKVRFTKKVVLLTAVISLFSSLLGTLWFTTALLKVNFIAFSVVFLIQKLQPLFTITTARLLLNEKIHRDYAVWAIIALVAAFFVTFPNGVVNLATGSGTVIAALYALGAAAAWGSTTAVSKLLIKDVGSTAATALRFLTTTVLALGAVFLMGQSSSLSMVGAPELLRFVFIALSTGMVALWIYYRGLVNTQAKVATILELTFPLLAIFIDTVLYKSVLQISQYVAAGLLMYAMYRVGQLQHSQDKS
jgi:drug/metabolite transporter (DMT)-like permease